MFDKSVDSSESKESGSLIHHLLKQETLEIFAATATKPKSSTFHSALMEKQPGADI